MKNLLNLESPLMQMLTRIGDLILLNVLFLICCIPVVTAGASIAALHRMTQEIVYETDSSTVKGFFRAFRANFKQATAVWLVVCVAAYMFPLLVRYENKLRNHLTNAVILAIIKLPRTLGMLALIAMPLIILTLDLNMFLQTLIFWIFIGFAFTTYMQTNLLKAVFTELEGGKDAVKVGI